MKKFFLMLAVVASCAVFTSCKSDAEKAAQLQIDIENAIKDGETAKATELGAELAKIVEANKDNADFEKQAKEAYDKLKK